MILPLAIFFFSRPQHESQAQHAKKSKGGNLFLCINLNSEVISIRERVKFVEVSGCQCIKNTLEMCRK